MPFYLDDLPQTAPYTTMYVYATIFSRRITAQ